MFIISFPRYPPIPTNHRHCRDGVTHISDSDSRAGCAAAGEWYLWDKQTSVWFSKMASSLLSSYTGNSLDD